MSEKVYVVWSGDSHEQDICGIFDTREGAEAFSKRIRDAEISEYPLNPTCYPPHADTRSDEEFAADLQAARANAEQWLKKYNAKRGASR